MFKLKYILKVSSPVRVFLIGSSSVPTLEGSFGPTPRSSSEGFLGSFTPGEGSVVVLFDYGFFPEYFCNGVIQIPLRGGETPAGQGWYRGPCAPALTGITPGETIVRGPGFFPESRWEAPTPRKDIRRLQRRIPGEALRLEVMTTGSPFRGILVPLKPTDEALEEGRNTKRMPHVEEVLRVFPNCSSKSKPGPLGKP
jgi:hypothetical protein